MDGRILARARDSLERLRNANEAERARREAEANAAIPELPRLSARFRELMGRVLRLSLSEDAAAELAEVERESQALCARKTELLTAHGYPADWLDTIYHCEKCHDSGYRTDGSMCACLRLLCEQEQAAELSEALRLGGESFSDFDLRWYSGAEREVMALTLDTAKNYAVRFARGSGSMLFQGGTGLGKTFLSGCIAKTVSARGFGVVYEGVRSAFAAFEEQKFSRDAETYAAATEKVRRILESDLLILDDLGTEMTTSFTQSALYSIVNTRLCEGRSTIISTNLSDAELEKRYLPQTVSRVLGEYDVLPFVGRDIRALKKEKRYI